MKNKEELTQPIPGIIYQHYKGGLYEPMCVAKHTTTGEKMVIYKSHTEGTIYARPLKEWYEKVKVDINVPNFNTMRNDVLKNQGEVLRFKIFSGDNIL